MTAEIIHFGKPKPAPSTEPAAPTLNYVPHRNVKDRIARHLAAREEYGKAVAWEVAAGRQTFQRLPPGQIEEARQRTAAAYADMMDRARQLVVCGAHDPKGLVDLLLYLEQNWTAFPEAFNKRALVFELLSSVRLSLRAIAKYGKYEGCRDDK